MKKTVFSLLETRQEAQSRARMRLLKAASLGRLARVKNSAKSSGIDFDSVFDVLPQSEVLEIEVKVDLSHLSMQLVAFFDMLDLHWRSLIFDVDETSITPRVAETVLGKALSLSMKQRHRVDHWAKFYASKFSDTDQITGRDAHDLRKQLLPASGPLCFAGPQTEHGVDEMISRVYEGAPWLKSPLNVIWRAAQNRMREEGYFGVFLVLLVGGHGTGKSSLARNIAQAAGVHHVEIDVGAGTSAMRISGVESGWASRQIGEVLRAVIDSGSPNPFIIINEVDKVGGGMSSTSGSRSCLTDALLPLLESSTAKHFRCPATNLTLDLSSVSWILTANDISAIDPVLMSRMRVVQIPPLSIEDVMLYIETHHGDLDPHVLFDLRMAILRGWSPAITLRHIDRIVAEIKGAETRALHH
jgi:ATP-dependent Lon protease